MDEPVLSRQPVWTLEEAIWKLLGLWADVYEMTEPHRALPVEAQLVCDLYWITDTQFRYLARKLWTDTFDKRTRFKPAHVRPGAVCHG